MQNPEYFPERRLENDSNHQGMMGSLQLTAFGDSEIPYRLVDERSEKYRSNGTFAPLRPDLQTILSAREIDILPYLVAGLPNKVIAKQLDIGEETVKVHVKGILRKLNVNNRTQAAVLAYSRGVEPAIQYFSD